MFNNDSNFILPLMLPETEPSTENSVNKMMPLETDSLAYETVYGTMEFACFNEAEEFKKAICSWEGFTATTCPNTVQEAVEYHLAYKKGGTYEVYALIREKQAELRAAVRLAESERRTRQELTTRFKHCFNRIDSLETQLSRAKTAALIDVTKIAAQRGDWATARLILSYLDHESEVPTLEPNSIIEE